MALDDILEVVDRGDRQACDDEADPSGVASMSPTMRNPGNREPW
jgi:hypothetical protein